VVTLGARHINPRDNLVTVRVDFNQLIPRLDVDEDVLRGRVILGVASLSSERDGPNRRFDVTSMTVTVPPVSSDT
jgi:hypothetical protein